MALDLVAAAREIEGSGNAGPTEGQLQGLAAHAKEQITRFAQSLGLASYDLVLEGNTVIVTKGSAKLRVRPVGETQYELSIEGSRPPALDVERTSMPNGTAEIRVVNFLRSLK
jgi:hypothetical protein